MVGETGSCEEGSVSRQRVVFTVGIDGGLGMGMSLDMMQVELQSYT